MQKATQLYYTRSGNLTLQDHCFQNGYATLCAIGQQQLLPQTHINYQLSQFPLVSLTPWLPHGFRWQGVLSGKIDLNMLPEGTNGKIAINANNSSFTLKPNAGHESQNYTYQEFSLISKLMPNKANVAIKFNSNSLGKIKMIAELDSSTKNKPLKGAFTITGLHLNIFQPFIAKLEQLTGKINSFANISNTLTKPYITGKIKLIDDNMSGDTSISLEKVPIAAAIEGESLKVNGDWHSGSNGYGTVTGIIAWSKELDVNLSMQTDKLPS